MASVGLQTQGFVTKDLTFRKSGMVTGVELGRILRDSVIKGAADGTTGPVIGVQPKFTRWWSYGVELYSQAVGSGGRAMVWGDSYLSMKIVNWARRRSGIQIGMCQYFCPPSFSAPL